MATDNRHSSKSSDQDPKRRKSAADFRASHRIHSAASAERKKALGFVRLSVWVPRGHADALKHFARCLCDGNQPDQIKGAQAEERTITGTGVIPTRRRKKRKNQPCDEGQLDLFGPA